MRRFETQTPPAPYAAGLPEILSTAPRQPSNSAEAETAQVPACRRRPAVQCCSRRRIDETRCMGCSRSKEKVAGVIVRAWSARSEEHTSELQSLRHLVCRL